jgi:hypothetical protein
VIANSDLPSGIGNPSRNRAGRSVSYSDKAWVCGLALAAGNKRAASEGGPYNCEARNPSIHRKTKEREIHREKARWKSVLHPADSIQNDEPVVFQ